MRFLKSFILGNFFKKKLNVYKNLIFYPWLLTKESFSVTPYDKYNLVNGKSDEVVCFDQLEINALQQLIPTAKGLHLACHPLVNTCRCQNKSAQNKNKILLLIGGHRFNSDDEVKFAKWIRVVRKLMDLTSVSEFDVRFHPRIPEGATFPELIIEAIEKLGCSITVKGALDYSLSEIVCDYLGVVSAPGSQLRIARFSCDRCFIVGLSNLGFAYNFDEKILGNSEGIRWVTEQEELEEKHLEVPSTDFQDRDSIPKILSDLCRTIQVSRTVV
jgi:hypothetical protein